VEANKNLEQNVGNTSHDFNLTFLMIEVAEEYIKGGRGIRYLQLDWKGTRPNQHVVRQPPPQKQNPLLPTGLDRNPLPTPSSGQQHQKGYAPVSGRVREQPAAPPTSTKRSNGEGPKSPEIGWWEAGGSDSSEELICLSRVQSSEQSAGRAHPLSSENQPILMREEAGGHLEYQMF
jgi:hypothetical protein